MSCALSLSNKWMNKHTVKKKHKFRFQEKNCLFGFQQFSHCTFVSFAAGCLSATLHQTESTQLFFPKKIMDSTGFERIENHMSASIFHEHQIDFKWLKSTDPVVLPCFKSSSCHFSSCNNFVFPQTPQSRASVLRYTVLLLSRVVHADDNTSFILYFFLFNFKR